MLATIPKGMDHPPESKSIDELCGRLRALAQDCLGKHMYDSAAFFAEKLVALAGNKTDIFLQAQVRS